MDSIAQATPEHQDMQLPKGQDVIRPDADLLGWTEGVLPNQQLEQIALKIFARQFPMVDWGNPVFKAERDDCRRFALQLRVDFLKLDRWSAVNAADRLAEQSARVVFGDRPLGRTIRKEIAEVAEAYVSDLWITFRNRLFYAREVEANNAEVNQERAQ